MLMAAFLIPWIAMASWFALSQTHPPTITIPVLNDVMRLTPIWHNLPTAYRNQHRLIIAGLPVAIILALAALMIRPSNRKTITAFILGSTLITALAANGLDCSWLFRTRPEWIGAQTMIRSIPWLAIGAITCWLFRRKKL